MPGKFLVARNLLGQTDFLLFRAAGAQTPIFPTGFGLGPNLAMAKSPARTKMGLNALQFTGIAPVVPHFANLPLASLH